MTELIVALDGPNSIKNLFNLHRQANVTWFKVRPLTYLDPVTISTLHLQWAREEGLQIFADLKLADHGPYVCGEYAKRLVELGYASLSTSTDAATEAALRGAEGSSLKVWRHVAPTHRDVPYYRAVDLIERAARQGVHGVICGAWFISATHSDEFPTALGSLDIVCPAVRLEDEGHDHLKTTTPAICNFLGVTHVVVGRPIYNTPDPVAAAKRYLEALR